MAVCVVGQKAKEPSKLALYHYAEVLVASTGSLQYLNLESQLFGTIRRVVTWLRYSSINLLIRGGGREEPHLYQADNWPRIFVETGAPLPCLLKCDPKFECSTRAYHSVLDELFCTTCLHPPPSRAIALVGCDTKNASGSSRSTSSEGEVTAKSA